MNGSEYNPEKPEMKYFNLINNILDVIVELDLEYKITFINPQVYDVFGYNSEEVIGESSLDYIHPDDVSRTVKAIEKGIETREIISIELRIKHIDNNYIPVSAKGYLVEYDDQIKIIAGLRDLTDIKRAQQNLLESDKKYKEIIENMEDGYFEVDLKGSFIYVNDYICKFLGISKNELLGKSYEIILEKNTINDVYQNFNHLYENELPKGTFESQVIRNDRTKRIFEGSFYLKYDSSGKKIGFYGFTRDITEKKLVEKTIKESEEKFRTIFNSIPDLFFLVDQDSVILEFSGKQEDLYVQPKEYLRKKMINVLPSDVGKLYKTAISKVLSSGKPQVVEYHLMIGNKKKHFEARHLLFTKDRIAIFIRNITEKKEIIEKLKQSEEKYREAFNRAELYKDLFYHDMNNILSNVKFSIDMSEKYLSESGKENEILDLYKVIRGQFAKGSKLINNVRKLSYLEKLDDTLKIVEVTKVLTEAINYIKSSLQTQNIKVYIELSESRLYVRANELLMDVFDNLLFNAISYNENSIKEVTIKISREIAKNEKYIKFEFIDNGIGISNKRKKNLFQDRFKKVEGSKGMGFGLSLVKKIIDCYKGEIWVEDRIKNDYTQGSNFVFLIPEAIK